jgi:hypothetical protein
MQRTLCWADALALRGTRFDTSLSLLLADCTGTNNDYRKTARYTFKNTRARYLRRIISGDTEALGFHRGLRSVSAVIAAREVTCYSKQLYVPQGSHSAMLQRSLLTHSKHAS